MREHWLARPATVRRLWQAFLAVLALTLLAEPLVARHPHFVLDGLFGFNAWYGFATCVAMIVAAKALGRLLKRPDRYYDRP